MTRAQVVRTGGAGRRLVGWIVRLVLAVALLAGWAAWEMHAASSRAVAQLQDVTATAVEQFDAFIGRFSGVAGQFGAAAVAPPSRIDIAVRMLKVEPTLAPAQSLFLYDAAGHFIAATVPLLPGDADVSGRPWFETAAAHAAGPLLLPTPAAPLGQGAGFVISQTIRDRSGGVVGVIGTFLNAGALRGLITPPVLPPGATVSLTETGQTGSGQTGSSQTGSSQTGSGQTGPALSFTVGTAAPHPALLDNALEWMGEMPRIGEIAEVPAGMSLRIDADVFADITAADMRTVLEHGAALLVAILVLLWLFRPRRRGAVVPERMSDRSLPAPEIEWGWEIDSRGRLVGVAGNAPTPLLSAVGTNFLDLVADDARGRDLREAIAERIPIHDLELCMILPGNPHGVRRRYRVSGRFVADTGGFWGTAEEIPAIEAVKEAAD